MRHFLLGVLGTLLHLSAPAQLLGGATSFNFLRVPGGALGLAQGGLVLTAPNADLSAAYQNPALLEPVRQAEVHSSVAFYPGQVKGFFLSGTLTKPTAPFVAAASVHYLDYGTTPLTDAGGNVLGTFWPSDWVMQLSASMPYQERWRGGASLKFAHSSYGGYRASAFLADVGLRYRDTSQGFECAALLRNTGFFLRRYTIAANSELPLELSFGITKKLLGSPFSVGLVLQRMQSWSLDSDALYDPQFSSVGSDSRRSTFVGQFFNHLIFSTRVDLHPRLQLLGGYNFLRRRELSWAGASNGLTGFSLGMRADLDRFQLHYGRVYYQAGQAINQLSVQLALKPVSKGWKR